MKSVSQCKDAAGVQRLLFWFRALESVHKQVVDHYKPSHVGTLCILESNPAIIVSKGAEDASQL